MNEEMFKTIFISSFCAAWCANNYDYFCATGLQLQLENPPVEDAIDMANSAWIKLKTGGT